LEKQEFRIPVFGEALFQISKVWKSQSSEFQCLENPNFGIPVFGKAKLQNCDVWKSQISGFQ